MGTGTYGGYAPGFERYGGHRGDVLKTLLESIAQQRGTAFDTTSTSNVYPENMAIARCLAECWSTLNRMANQWDAKRMTDFVPRWERILGLVPLKTDTMVDRRNRIGAKFAQASLQGIYQTVYDQMVSALGSVFVGFDAPWRSNSVWSPGSGPLTRVWVPLSWQAGLPGSSVDSTGLIDWTSLVATLSIVLQQPTGMSNADFYATAAKMHPILDQILPAWMTWQWRRQTPLHIIPIASSTNTDPVVVTLSTAGTPWAAAGIQHGFIANQTVTITGSIVGINGTWVTTAVGGTTSGGTGTTITLPNIGSGGPTSTGVGGAVGTVSAPGFFLDGDPINNPSNTTLVNLDNEAFGT